MRTGVLAALMVGSVALVAALAFVESQRESRAALNDFAEEQAIVAASVSESLAARLELLAQHGPGARSAPPALLAEMARLEHPATLAIFVGEPGGALRGTDGRELGDPEILGALSSGRSTARITPTQAQALGLKPRTAMAGLARVDAGPLGTWRVAVVASAERERDREWWARVRLALSILLSAGLVLGFGGFALRQQRKELELERELAVADAARERDERLAKLSRARTMLTLASGLAHEISTPMGVISGRAEQLLPRGDERTRRGLQVILDQCDHVKDVVRGFLDLARGGTPRFEAVESPMLISAAIALVQHRFEKAGVRVVNSAPASLPRASGERTLLEHALVNLLLNACDACGRGGTVEVSAWASPGTISFAVQDDGPGITATTAVHAVEPFFTTKQAGRGTGLGLAIVNEIAKSHGGTFTIQPRDGRGTLAVLQVRRELAAGDSEVSLG